MSVNKQHEENICQGLEITKQVDSDGWITIVYGLDENNTPPEGKYILLSFSNFDLPVIGRYEDGAFYDGDNNQPLASYGVFVNAWQPLPGPYREETEQ